VSLRQRTNVEESEHVLILIHLVARDFAADDAGEDGVAHAAIVTAIDAWGLRWDYWVRTARIHVRLPAIQHRGCRQQNNTCSQTKPGAI
jgi:hypothetical protein